MFEREVILRTLCQLAEPFAAILPGDCEVVVHDLSKLPNSIVQIAGNVTGRTVGGPATDQLLREAAESTLTTRLGYPGHTSDGRVMRSSTIVFRDTLGEAVAALCINNDTQSWHIAEELIRSMLPWRSGDTEGEKMAHDVDELSQQLLQSALNGVHIPVELMQKRHKLSVVRDLKDRGFFGLRESAETAAQALGVTRFSIYNYLREIAEEGQTEPEEGS